MCNSLHEANGDIEHEIFTDLWQDVVTKHGVTPNKLLSDPAEIGQLMVDQYVSARAAAGIPVPKHLLE